MADEPREWIKQERTRREFLKIAGIAGATVGLGAGLGGIVAACGGAATTTTTGGATTTAGGATTTTAAGATTTTGAGIPHAAGVKLMDEFYTLDQVYWQLWDKGASAACAALGLTHIRVVDNSDVGTQIAAFENAPTQDIHMAITISWNQSSSPQIAKVCNDSKIYLQNVWSNAPWSTPLDAGDYYVSWLTGDDTLAGYTIAKGIFDLMGGKGEFIHVNGPPGNSSGVLRDIGVDKALKEYPNVKMVARQPGGLQAQRARPAARPRPGGGAYVGLSHPFDSGARAAERRRSTGPVDQGVDLGAEHRPQCGESAG